MLLTEEELKNEIWKDIEGYENLYKISNMGRVKSIKNDNLLRLSTQIDGYIKVGLSKNNKQSSKLVHRLVCESFLKNVENKPYVNHINSVRNDNRLTNLNYVTPSENMSHAIKIGNLKTSKKNRYNNLLKILNINFPIKTSKTIEYNGIIFDNYIINTTGEIISLYKNDKIILKRNDIILYKNKIIYEYSRYGLLYYNFIFKKNDNEIWKTFPENSKYLISNYGNVKSITGRICTIKRKDSGYLYTSLSKKTYYIHRLVAITFIPNINMNQLQVNHINLNKSDNNISNLEWCTRSENMKHFTNSIIDKPKNRICKLSEEQVIEIFYDKEPIKKIIEKYNIGRTIIYDIKNKKKWLSVTKNLN